jgi:hypothetical protein
VMSWQGFRLHLFLTAHPPSSDVTNQAYTSLDFGRKPQEPHICYTDNVYLQMAPISVLPDKRHARSTLKATTMMFTTEVGRQYPTNYFPNHILSRKIISPSSAVR